MLFLARVSFSGLSACPFWASGTETQKWNSVFPRNILILGAMRIFLASVSFRELARGSGGYSESPHAGGIRRSTRIVLFSK